MTPDAPLGSHNTEADSTDAGTSLSRRALIAAGALSVVGLPAAALANTAPILLAQTSAPAPEPTQIIEGELCNILDIPGGLKLNLLGLMVTVGPTMIDANRAGLARGSGRRPDVRGPDHAGGGDVDADPAQHQQDQEEVARAPRHPQAVKCHHKPAMRR